MEDVRTNDFLTKVRDLIDTVGLRKTALAEAREELQQVRMEYWGLTPGCIVVDGKGVRYQFLSLYSDNVLISEQLRPWIRAYKIKKDGTPSQNKSVIYRDWTLDERT